jgi:pyruvate dehydrogenase E1 component beta subunit
MPSNPVDAKGLLKSAIRDQNPVIFIEHRGLYRAKAEVPTGERLVPLGNASIVREGTDLSIVAFGGMVAPALGASDELAASGIQAEVIDIRSLSPLDVPAIADSVKKTGRSVVVHEAVEQGGLGAEIIARIQQEAFYYLDAPILRVAAPFAPVPASPALEEAFAPAKDEIVKAALRVLGRG